jgi:hypothetical protein
MISGFSRLVSNFISLRTVVAGYILFSLKVERKHRKNGVIIGPHRTNGAGRFFRQLTLRTACTRKMVEGMDYKKVWKDRVGRGGRGVPAHVNTLWLTH